MKKKKNNKKYFITKGLVREREHNNNHSQTIQTIIHAYKITSD